MDQLLSSRNHQADQNPDERVVLEIAGGDRDDHAIYLILTVDRYLGFC